MINGKKLPNSPDAPKIKDSESKSFNYINENADLIGKRHYMILSTQPKYWFNIWPGQIEDYRNSFKKDFSIIIYRSKDNLDCYAIPFSELEKILKTDNLMPYQEKHLRWVGDVQNGKMTLKCSAKPVLDIQKYYNKISEIKECMKNFDLSNAVKSSFKPQGKARSATRQARPAGPGKTSKTSKKQNPKR